MLFSVLANIGAFWLIKTLYLRENLAHLDPLSLDVYPKSAPAKIPGRKRVVFFGDSRVLAWTALDIPGYEFINRGIGDQTSAQIRLRYDQHVAPLQADILILQLCVNDLKVIPLQPALYQTIVGQCQQNLQAIIDQALAAGSDVWVTTIFPLGVVPLERRLFWSDEVATAIQEVNQYILSLQQQGVTVFDSFAILQGDHGRIKPEYSRDLLPECEGL